MNSQVEKTMKSQRKRGQVGWGQRSLELNKSNSPQPVKGRYEGGGAGPGEAAVGDMWLGRSPIDR